MSGFYIWSLSTWLRYLICQVSVYSGLPRREISDVMWKVYIGALGRWCISHGDSGEMAPPRSPSLLGRVSCFLLCVVIRPDLHTPIYHFSTL